MFINLLSNKGKIVYVGENIIVGRIDTTGPEAQATAMSLKSIWNGAPQGLTRPNHPEVVVILTKNPHSLEIDELEMGNIRSEAYENSLAGEFWKILREHGNKVGVDRRKLFFSVYYAVQDKQEIALNTPISIAYKGAEGTYNQPGIKLTIDGDKGFTIAGDYNNDSVALSGIAFGTTYDMVHYNMNIFNWPTAKAFLDSRLACERIATNYVVIPCNSAPNSSTPVVTDEPPTIGTVDEIMNFCGLSNRKGSKIDTLIQGFRNIGMTNGTARRLKGKKFLLTLSTRAATSAPGFLPSDAAYKIMPWCKVLSTMQDATEIVHMLVEITEHENNDTIMNLYSLLDTSKRMVYTKMVAVEVATKAIDKMKALNT